MQNLIPLANPLENLPRIEYNGQLVLTYAQLADALTPKDQFGNPIGKPVTVQNLSANFKNNEDRFIEGKHFFKVEGDELEVLRSKNFGLQISPKTRQFYLWTKRGCARHCKSVGTDVAWDVYEALEDTYFAQVVDHDSPLPSINDYKLAIALTKLAAHADDPYMKKRLVVEAANRLLNEEVFPVHDLTPVVQLSLFK